MEPASPRRRAGCEWVLLLAVAALVLAAVYDAFRATQSTERVWHVDVAPDAAHVAIRASRSVRVYESATGDEVLAIPRGIASAFSRDGAHIAIVGGGVLGVFSLETMSVVASCDAPTTPRQRLVVGSRAFAIVDHDSCRMVVHDADGATLWETIVDDDSAVALSPDEDVLVTVGRPEEANRYVVRLWDASDGSEIGSVDGRRPTDAAEVHFIRGGDAIMVVAADGGGADAWDVSDPAAPTPIEVAPVDGHPRRHSADESLIAAPARDGYDTWELAVNVHESDGMLRFKTPPLRGLWWDAAFAGDELVVATTSGVLASFDATSGAPRAVRRGLRPSRWPPRVIALYGVIMLWLVLWLATMRGTTRSYAGVAASVGIASVLVLLTRVIQVVDPWMIDDPIGSYFAIVTLGGIGVLAMIVWAAFKRAFAALAASIVLGGTSFGLAAYLLIETIASV